MSCVRYLWDVLCKHVCMFHVIITSCSDVPLGPTGGMAREAMYPHYRVLNCFGENIVCLNQKKAWDQDLKLKEWSVEFCMKRIYTLINTQLNNTKVLQKIKKYIFRHKYHIKTPNIKLSIIQQHAMWIRCRYTVYRLCIALHQTI